MKKSKLPADLSFESQGRFYGYPPCCVSEFIIFVLALNAGFNPQREKRKLFGTEYVPCQKCNKKTEKQLLAAIKKNRECELPFPQQPEY